MSIGGAVAVYFLAAILARLPQIKPWAFVIKPIAILACAVSLFMWGGSGVAAIWQAQIQAQQAKVDAAVAQSRDANNKLSQVRKQKNRVIVQRQVVIHERIKTVEKQIDAECKVDPAAVKILNDAAANPETKK